MDFQTLQFFCTVASEGSLSKAAQKLHYAQSNLSTKIMQLEKEMGSSLFYRNNHGVTLTPKGELLLKYAVNLTNLAEETMVAMRDGGTAKGTLYIGSMESTVVTYLSSFLKQYHRKNPEVAIKVDTGNTETLLQKVLDHTLSGAFIAGPVGYSELITKQVRTEKLCLIVSRDSDHYRNTHDILQQPLLVFPQGCSYRKIFEFWLRDEGLTARKIYEFSTLNAIFASATAGLGAALFPEACIQQYRQKDALMVLDIPEQYAFVPTVFVYRTDSYLSSALSSFIDSIK